MTGATTIPFAVTLAASGLPTGATATFSPTGIAAGAGSTPETLTIQLPQDSAALQPTDNLGRKLAPFSLALLLLPFAGAFRKTGKRLSRTISVLLILGLSLAAAGVSGCGGSAPKVYTVIVTGTSNNQTSSTSVTLTVQ